MFPLLILFLRFKERPVENSAKIGEGKVMGGDGRNARANRLVAGHRSTHRHRQVDLAVRAIFRIQINNAFGYDDVNIVNLVWPPLLSLHPLYRLYRV